MTYERTDEERRSDDALLLTLWARAQEHAGGDVAGDKLKLMKLAFLMTYPLYRDGVKSLNLQFFKYTWGPMATGVYSNLDDLAGSGLILEEERYIVLDEGLRLARAFTDEVLSLPENAATLRVMEEVAREYGPLSTDEVLKRVYAMRCVVPGVSGRQLVSALDRHTDITYILAEDEADEVLVVPRHWRTTLELALNGTALRNLQRGIEDSLEGRVFGREAMWSDV